MAIDAGERFDAITLEVLWSRLIAVADEAALALVRTAFSTIVRESNDYSFVITDVSGESVAENSGGIPSFVGILPRTVRHFLSLKPAGDWRPGDVMITNDPWLATGHLPDATMVSPVFRNGELVAFVGAVAHLPDIGGGMWAADATEVFEEGLRIPPMAFHREGARNQDLFDLITANTRVPEQVIGDLYAQIAAHEVGARGIIDLLDDVGDVDLKALGDEVKRRAEQSMRAAIADVPDGCYTAQISTDGFDDPITLRVTVEVDGDALSIDYTGTSPQVGRGVNCVFNYTYAYSAYPIKCALDPFTPRNEGSYRPVTITAPRGTVVNPTFPAAVGARHLTGHVLASTVFAALAAAVPTQVIAESGGALMRAVFTGARRDDTRFSAIAWPTGGMGAGHDRDGLSTTAFPSNVGVGSIEALENATPLHIRSKTYRVDSGGAGTYRGGLGQDVVIEVRSHQPVRVALLADKVKHAPIGILGGRAGAGNDALLNAVSPLHPKSRFTVQPGDVVTLRYAGGGGYGAPEDRDEAAVVHDVREGYVSHKAAREIYGREVSEEQSS